MGKFANAVQSHRKHLFYSKEGGDSIIKEKAKTALAKDFKEMLAAIDDDFDQGDKEAYEWIREQE